MASAAANISEIMYAKTQERISEIEDFLVKSLEEAMDGGMYNKELMEEILHTAAVAFPGTMLPKMQEGEAAFLPPDLRKLAEERKARIVELSAYIQSPQGRKDKAKRAELRKLMREDSEY